MATKAKKAPDIKLEKAADKLADEGHVELPETKQDLETQLTDKTARSRR